MIENVNKPFVTLSHILTTVGLLSGLLVYVNATENKVERNEVKQEMMLKRQEEIKQDFNAYRTEQRQINKEQLKLLMEIKGKIDN